MLDYCLDFQQRFGCLSGRLFYLEYSYPFSEYSVRLIGVLRSFFDSIYLSTSMSQSLFQIDLIVQLSLDSLYRRWLF